MFDKSIFQLCNTITEAEADKLDLSKYICQEKKDGTRVIAIIQDNNVAMINRRGKIVNYHFTDIENELKTLDNCILDGEICSYDDKFETLQKVALTQNTFKIKELQKQIPCTFWIFDILKIENNDLMLKPLRERVRELYNFFDGKELQRVKILPFEEYKESLFKAKERKGEGIIIKLLDGIYENRRSNNFLKLKFFCEQEMIIISAIQNPAGYRCEDKDGNSVQVSGRQSLEVIRQLNEKGQVNIIVQYLTKSKEGRMRFPSFRQIK